MHQQKTQQLTGLTAGTSHLWRMSYCDTALTFQIWGDGNALQWHMGVYDISRGQETEGDI